MMHGKSIFIDTNVLIYATNENSSEQKTALRAIKELLESDSQIHISNQILREYLVVVTRNNIHYLKQAISNVNLFEDVFLLLDDNPVVRKNLIRVVSDYQVTGKQVHDANIVATMQAYKIKYLLTKNVNDFRRFLNLITIIEPDDFG